MNKLFDDIASLETKKLAKMLFRQKDDYVESILEEIRAELKRRDFKPENVIEEVGFRFNLDDQEGCTIEDVLAKLDMELSNWDIFYFTNFFDEQLAVQNSPSFWVLFYFDKAEHYSFGISRLINVKNVVQNFLKLEDWKPAEEDKYLFEDWESFHASNSILYVNKLEKMLKKLGTPYLLQDMNAWHVVQIFGSHSSNELYHILLPPEHMGKCEQALVELENKINYLNQKLEEAEQSNNTKWQLEIYEKMKNAEVNDPVLYYNEGCLLIDLNRLDEAAEAFIESHELDSLEGNMESAAETEKVLKDMLNEIPNNIDILQTLALISVNRNDVEEAINLYQKIILFNENNSNAHLHLGYLYFSSDGKDELTRNHFHKYIELEPDAKDKDEIKQFLSKLN